MEIRFCLPIPHMIFKSQSPTVDGLRIGWSAKMRQAVLIFLAALAAGCTSVHRVEKPLPTVSSVHSPDFSQAMGSMLGATFLPGNRIATLSDGDEIFPAMLDAIRKARRTITFETFIFHHDAISRQFVDALAERARAGVEVKMIADGVGSIDAGDYFSDLRAAGVQLEIYRPIWSRDFFWVTYRTHRKLLIVDGKVGFIGGVGIGDSWRGHAKSDAEWRELHYRVEGPVVAQMQGAFHANWFSAHREVILGPGYFPVLPAAGPARAGAFFSAPYRGRYLVDLMYHLAIAGARKSILIENPYFVPDEPLTEALCAAAKRGVKVQVIMAGRHIDFSMVRMASRQRWPRLKAAGVELYEYQGTLLHSKLLVVDGYFVSVGSANFDPRSLAINDEANLNVLDESFASQQMRIFQQDLMQSKPAKIVGTAWSELPMQWLQQTLEPQL